MEIILEWEKQFLNLEVHYKNIIMKRFSITILFCFIVIFTIAQQRGSKDIDVTKFPEVTFIWNEYNPNPINKNQVEIIQDGEKLNFTWNNIKQQNFSNKKKSILILWEDMYSHKGQYDFIRMTLSNFFSLNADNGDKFNIVVFNRDQADGNFMRSISDGFISNSYDLISCVNRYEADKKIFDVQTYNSNVYQAINEGISLLDNESKDNLKVIIVMTAGMNVNTAGSSKDLNTLLALEKNIPIYVVKYPIKGDFSKKDVEGVEKITYGSLIIPESNKDDIGAANQMYDAYLNMAKRYYGQDYKVSFKAPHEQDGKSHQVLLNINGNTKNITYVAPDYTFELWLEDNLILFICLIILVLIIVVLSVVLGIRINRNKKIASSQKEAQIQKKLDEEAKKRQEEINRIKEENELDRQKEIARSQEEENRKNIESLAILMRNKNLYPRLICNVGNDSIRVNIENPITKIGRNKDNDIVFEPKTVSRHHADIIFNGVEFEIVNRSTTNKIIVNGAFVDKIALKSGDVIGIGEVAISFVI